MQQNVLYNIFYRSQVPPLTRTLCLGGGLSDAYTTVQGGLRARIWRIAYDCLILIK